MEKNWARYVFTEIVTRIQNSKSKFEYSNFGFKSKIRIYLYTPSPKSMEQMEGLFHLLKYCKMKNKNTLLRHFPVEDREKKKTSPRSSQRFLRGWHKKTHKNFHTHLKKTL